MHLRRRCRTTWVSLLGLLLALQLPLAAHAEGASEVRTYVTSIHRLYENLEYERALEQISRAKRLAQGVDDDVILTLYEGVILADLNRLDEATAAFKSALLLRPEAKLPVVVAPKVARLFERLRKEAKRELARMGKGEAERRQAQARPRTPEPPNSSTEVPAEETRASEAVAPQPPPAPAAATEVSSRASLRSRALLPALAGGVLLAAGGVSYGMARSEQNRLRTGAPELDTLEAARTGASRGRTWQTVGFGLLGAGVVSLGIATGMYVLGAPTEPVALGVGTDGTSAFVYGRWP